MDPTEIRALIEQNLGNSSAEVHTDGQGHYEATVICPAFAGKRSLQRHQMVYATLGARACHSSGVNVCNASACISRPTREPNVAYTI